jgi:hypothetical protein
MIPAKNGGSLAPGAVDAGAPLHGWKGGLNNPIVGA